MDACPLCRRDLVPGPSIDEHHLIPKLKGGKKGPKVTLHKVCHNKIHSLFSEAELARKYNNIDALLEHEDIQTFVKWVAKKHPEFHEPSKETGGKKNKRRR